MRKLVVLLAATIPWTAHAAIDSPTRPLAGFDTAHLMPPGVETLGTGESAEGPWKLGLSMELGGQNAVSPTITDGYVDAELDVAFYKHKGFLDVTANGDDLLHDSRSSSLDVMLAVTPEFFTGKLAGGDFEAQAAVSGSFGDETVGALQLLGNYKNTSAHLNFKAFGQPELSSGTVGYTAQLSVGTWVGNLKQQHVSFKLAGSAHAADASVSPTTKLKLTTEYAHPSGFRAAFIVAQRLDHDSTAFGALVGFDVF